MIRLAAERDAAGAVMPPGVPASRADRAWRDELFLAGMLEEAGRDPWHVGRLAARRLAQFEDAEADPHPGAVLPLPDVGDEGGGAAAVGRGEAT